jgi:TRAP-type C4-dicarboxylate transport system permease small subunit
MLQPAKISPLSPSDRSAFQEVSLKLLDTEDPAAGRFGSAILIICRYAAFVAAACLFVMMILTVADVCGRYFFLAPIEGTFELVGILLVIAGSLGLGYAQINNQNIRITVIADRFTLKAQTILFILAYLIACATSFLIMWRGWIRGWEYIFRDLGSTTVTLGLPFWPFMLMLSIGFGWVLIIFIADLVKSCVEVFKHGTD